MKAEILKNEEDLLNARKAAEDQMIFISKFLTHLHSELYESLNAIISTSSLLLNQVSISKEKYFIEKIKLSAEALSIYINNFQDFLNTDETKIELRCQEFNLYKSIENSIELLRDTANNKKLKLDWKIEENVPEMINGDPSAIRQVLVNLLSNSIIVHCKT